MNYQYFFDLCKKRKSTRVFIEKKIPDNDMIKILEAGIYAPSGSNMQAWKVKIITGKNEIKKCALIIEKKLNKITGKLAEFSVKETFEEYGKNFFFFNTASCLFLFYSHKPRKINELIFGKREQLYKGEGVLLSLGMAIQNMMLAAVTLGISTCPMTGPLIAEKELSLAFPQPKKFELSGLLALGYTDKAVVSPTRKSLEKYLFNNDAIK